MTHQALECRLHLRVLVDTPDGPVCPACVLPPEMLRQAETVERRERLRERMRAMGKKGGQARAAALTAERRREISRMGNDAQRRRRT